MNETANPQPRRAVGRSDLAMNTVNSLATLRLRANQLPEQDVKLLVAELHHTANALYTEVADAVPASAIAGTLPAPPRLTQESRQLAALVQALLAEDEQSEHAAGWYFVDSIADARLNDGGVDVGTVDGRRFRVVVADVTP